MADENNLGPDYNPEGPRITAAGSLERIAQRHRAARAECVAALVEQLKLYAENEPSLNGFLVSSLLDLDASEALPIIDRAYGAGHVDEMICGDLREVRTAFGLLPPGETPKPKFLGSKKPFFGF